VTLMIVLVAFPIVGSPYTLTPVISDTTSLFATSFVDKINVTVSPAAYSSSLTEIFTVVSTLNESLPLALSNALSTVSDILKLPFDVKFSLGAP